MLRHVRANNCKAIVLADVAQLVEHVLGGPQALPTALEGVSESRITVNLREDKTVAP